LARALVGAGVKKATLPIGEMIVLGILAGLYIGFAAHLATTVATGWGGLYNPQVLNLAVFTPAWFLGMFNE